MRAATFPLPAGFETSKKKQDRREFYRGWVETGDDGIVRAMKFPRDGSGLISGLREATGLIEILEETQSVAEGSLCKLHPL